jgi:phosphohistidine phosphatase
MDLLVVRHAIAYERDRKRWPDDSNRPLTPEGMKLARKAAAGLKRIVDGPDVVLTSPLARAKQTATILEHSAGWPEALEAAELAPDNDPQKVLSVLRRQRGTTLAVVGHEPQLSELINLCLVSEREGLRLELKKPGVACLNFKGLPSAGTATLRWFMAPRMLRALE